MYATIYRDITNCFMIYIHGVIAKQQFHCRDDRVTNSGLVVMMSTRYPGTGNQRQMLLHSHAMFVQFGIGRWPLGTKKLTSESICSAHWRPKTYQNQIQVPRLCSVNENAYRKGVPSVQQWSRAMQIRPYPCADSHRALSQRDGNEALLRPTAGRNQHSES